MFCYSATRKPKASDGTVARVQNEKKKQNGSRTPQYIEAESMISLEKYDEKLMNAIWGRYNR